MTSSFLRTRVRRIKRRLHSRRFILLAGAVIFFIFSIGYAVYMNQRRFVVDPLTYRPLLQLIARVESNDNYNAYFGNSHNKSVVFTTMSIAQVQQWQQQYIQQGSPSDAVGRYQIISPTLAGLVDQLGIDPDHTFDQSMQDRLAYALLQRRGGDQYINRELSAQQFAANLAKEWAALPRVIGDNPASSYYASDGLNRSLVKVDEVLRAIEPISAQ